MHDGLNTVEGRKVSIDGFENTPQTGHALLKEGSVHCIALSRKGIFTAGKVCRLANLLEIPILKVYNLYFDSAMHSIIQYLLDLGRSIKQMYCIISLHLKHKF